MENRESGLNSEKELVDWARKYAQYSGEDDPKKATEHLMAYGLCPISHDGKIFIESWG